MEANYSSITLLLYRPTGKQNKMKCSDFIADFIASQGVKHVFGITGGAAVHMVDSIYRHPDLEFVCVNHEQAAAMAADAYARVTGGIGVALTTSGPGATNLLTGTCCSWFDSVPVLNITGQVVTGDIAGYSKVRQMGFQETDVCSIFKTVTKMVSQVHSPERLHHELAYAIFKAEHQRPGPILLDVPDDIQRADIEPSVIETPQWAVKSGCYDTQVVAKVLRALRRASQPILVLGAGIHQAHVERGAIELLEKLGIPVLLTWGAIDLLPHNHPLNVGTFGVAGTRYGNMAIQNADFILTLGTRLDTHEVGSNPSLFAPMATKYIVDIDSAELDKYENRGMKRVKRIKEHLGDFLPAMIQKASGHPSGPWLSLIGRWKRWYPIVKPEYWEDTTGVNPYCFVDALSDACGEGDIIIADSGQNLCWMMQAWKTKKGQRIFSAFNHSPMGYALPAAIGAAKAAPDKRVIAVMGDGAFQMNVQELAVIAKHNLNIKIFVVNNGGYGMIRQTQDTWLEGRHVASTPEGGLALPDITVVAQAFGFEFAAWRISSNIALESCISAMVDSPSAQTAEVFLSPKATITPKVLPGKALDDLEPTDKREPCEAWIA